MRINKLPASALQASGKEPWVLRIWCNLLHFPFYEEKLLPLALGPRRAMKG